MNGNLASRAFTSITNELEPCGDWVGGLRLRKRRPHSKSRLVMGCHKFVAPALGT
jgi:hypothetical protein